jgi:hypothetical protein
MKDIPAFPQYVINYGGAYVEGGMTLRDYFAAQALTGAQIWDAVLNGKNAQLAQGGAEKLSDIAYAVADAMMESRNATQ